MGNGLLKKVSIRKRPGTVGICAALMNRYKVDAIPILFVEDSPKKKPKVH